MSHNMPATLHSMIHRLQDTAFLGAFTLALRQHGPTILKDKVVAVIGDGIGFLAVVAAQAGAAKVYAIEDSALTLEVPTLAAANGVAGQVIAVRAKVAAVELPEKVDVVLAMPMALMCIQDCTLQDLLTMRDRWLKPGGLVIPRELTLITAPLQDKETHAWMQQQADFWKTSDFFGIDYSCQHADAVLEHFAQPIAGRILPESLMCASNALHKHRIKLQEITIEGLNEIVYEFEFDPKTRGTVHGFGFWFELALGLSSMGSAESKICTGPGIPDGEWYICRMILPKIMVMNSSSKLSGCVRMKRNKLNSYDVEITANVSGKQEQSSHSFSLMNHTCSAMGSIGDVTNQSASAPGATDAAWYVASGANTHQGPFTKDQINVMICETGTVSAGTLIWQDGMSNWKPAGQVMAFQGNFGHRAPPPAPSAPSKSVDKSQFRW